MENEKALDFFQKISLNSDVNSLHCKFSEVNDHTQMDADFILKYVNSKSEILDLGSGSGLIINKIYDQVGRIIAVEPFLGFSQFIEKNTNIQVYNQTMMDFNSDYKFDLVTIFGTMHYFSEDESVNIYTKYKNNIKMGGGGKLIVKNQFGVKEDVIVEGYSEELKENYFAQYRHIGKEVKILKTIGYKNIEVFDIYPPECNRWDNTHFYAIVAENL